MIYYGFAAVAPLVCWAICSVWQKENRLKGAAYETLKKRLTVLAVLPMFLMFVLRYKYVGPDTIGYVRFFQNDIRQYRFGQLLSKDFMRFEIGFRLYVKIISLFTSNYTVYFFINGCIIFGTLLRFSLKYTKNPFVFFFLFMTLGTYAFFETGLRQALAMTVCLWSIDFIKDKKLWKFVLTVILAYYFHKSAIIFLITYPLCSIKKYDWMLFVYAVLAIVLTIGFTYFQNIFNQLLGYEYDVEETGNGGIFLMFISVIFLFSFYILYDKKGEDKVPSYIMHLSLITVVFWVLRLISRTAERISYYYMFGLYAYFSQATNYQKDRLDAFLKWLLILACLFLFVYRNNGISYRFFWQGA